MSINIYYTIGASGRGKTGQRPIFIAIIIH